MNDEVKVNKKSASEKSTNNKQPFAIVTDQNDIVTKDIYDRYAIKDDEGNSTSPTQQLDDSVFESLYQQNSLVRPLYDPTMLSALLEVNTFHNRCVKTKAQDIVGTGWRLEPQTDNPSEEEKQRIEELFNNQFPPVSTEFVKAEIDYQSIGYCFLELVKEGNRHDTVYKYINHAPAHTIRVHDSKMKFAQKRAGKTVWFKHPDLNKDVHKDTGEEYPEGQLSSSNRANDMIMMFEYTPRSSFYGLPNIIDALGAIQGNLEQRKYNNAFFRNHGIPNYAVYITGDYDLEQDGEGKYKVVEQIKQYLNTVRNHPHSSLVFGIPSVGGNMGEDVEVHFEEISTTEKDASFRMYRQDNRDEIIISHGMPPYRIGLAKEGSLGGNTAKESNTIYKESVVSPREEEWEQYINKFIIRDNLEVEDWKFIIKPLTFKNEEQDRKNLEFLFENGGASPNDLIKNLGQQYGIEPDEDNPALEAHYINGKPITKLDELEGSPLLQPSGGQVTMSRIMKSREMQDLDQLFRAMKDRLSNTGKKRRDN